MSDTNNGWIKLYRSIQNHWVWKDKPFSKGQAFTDLVMSANYKDVKLPYKGEVITCKRGDVNLSKLQLAERWGWSRGATDRFLKMLECDEMVIVKATTHRTTITLVNYDKYQNQGTTEYTTDDTTSEQQADSKEYNQVDTTKNIRTENKVKNDNKEKKYRLHHGKYSNVALADDELSELINEYGVEKTEKAIKYLDEYIEEKGYKSESHCIAIRRWVMEAISKKSSINESKYDWENI